MLVCILKIAINIFFLFVEIFFCPKFSTKLWNWVRHFLRGQNMWRHEYDVTLICKQTKQDVGKRESNKAWWSLLLQEGRIMLAVQIQVTQTVSLCMCSRKIKFWGGNGPGLSRYIGRISRPNPCLPLCSAYFEPSCFERNISIDLGDSGTSKGLKRYLKKGSMPTSSLSLSLLCEGYTIVINYDYTIISSHPIYRLIKIPTMLR